MREPATEDLPLGNPPYRGGILNGFDLNDRSRRILAIGSPIRQGPNSTQSDLSRRKYRICELSTIKLRCWRAERCVRSGNLAEITGKWMRRFTAKPATPKNGMNRDG